MERECNLRPLYLMKDGVQIRKIEYYPDLFLYLIGQIVMFLMPMFVWQFFEDGQIQSIANHIAHEMENNTEQDAVCLLKKYVFGRYKLLALKYYFCEFLCVANLFGQFILTDYYLGGGFLYYGLNFRLTSEEIFPPRAQCKL